ncbi:hypothetical protein [Tenacibaculum sp.]|uniref:hypothetical protein n=1 Tax=Tenacibaculum sp. TaxID=1906242 RepID=UPI003D0A7880
MKYLNILIIAILFWGCSSARNLEKIENHEVIFVLFKKSEFTSKSVNKPNISQQVTIGNKPQKMDWVNYDYNFNDKKGIKSHFFLTYSDYNDFDDFDNDVRKKIKFKINKSFLKSNKNRIITNDLISQFGINRIRRIFYNARTIFLIDEDEIKKGEVLIRQVKYDYFSEE